MNLLFQNGVGGTVALVGALVGLEEAVDDGVLVELKQNNENKLSTFCAKQRR